MLLPVMFSLLVGMESACTYDKSEFNKFVTEVKEINATELGCTSGWTKFQDNCYYHYSGEPINRTFTWKEADQLCENLGVSGSQLATIHSTEENYFLAEWARFGDPAHCSSAWIGLWWLDGEYLWWGTKEKVDYAHDLPLTSLPDPLVFYLKTSCFGHHHFRNSWIGVLYNGTDTVEGVICKTKLSEIDVPKNG